MSHHIIPFLSLLQSYESSIFTVSREAVVSNYYATNYEYIKGEDYIIAAIRVNLVADVLIMNTLA